MNGSPLPRRPEYHLRRHALKLRCFVLGHRWKIEAEKQFGQCQRCRYMHAWGAYGTKVTNCTFSNSPIASSAFRLNDNDPH